MARARKFKFNADTPSFICAPALQVGKGTIRTLQVMGDGFTSFNCKFESYQFGSLDTICLSPCNFLTYFTGDFLEVQQLGRLSVLLDTWFSVLHTFLNTSSQEAYNSWMFSRLAFLLCLGTWVFRDLSKHPNKSPRVPDDHSRWLLFWISFFIYCFCYWHRMELCCQQW